MKKLFYLLALLPLLVGCGEKPNGEPSEPVLPDDGSGQPPDVTPSDGGDQGGETTPGEGEGSGEGGEGGEGQGGDDTPVTTPGYFKQFADQAVGHEDTLDTTFINLYDAEANRFMVSFVFEPHFHFGLVITDYSLDFEYLSPNEGTFSEDYETFTSTLTAYSTNATFKRGSYVLSHSLVDGVDQFALNAAGVQLALTTTPKAAPTYICSDLVGTFKYSTSFEVKVEVGERDACYPATISIKEGDNTFTASNLVNSSNKTTFNIEGAADGALIKRGAATLSYSDNTGKVKLQMGDNSYNLEEVEEETVATGYFNTASIVLTHTDFTIQMNIESANLDTGTRFIRIIETGYESWVINMMCSISKDANTLTSQQSIGTHYPRQIFYDLAIGDIVIVHRVESGNDIIDLYLKGVLTYPNLAISPFVPQS